MRKTSQANSNTRKPPSATDDASVSFKGRVLILAPTGNDARLTADFLIQAGLPAQICRDATELCAELGRGCGAMLLAEETLGQSSIPALAHALMHQPPWSDIPVTVITTANHMRAPRLDILGPGGNVGLLERPFRPGTLVSTMKAALRGRQRQYEMQGLLQEVQETQQRYSQLVHGLPTALYTTDAQGHVILYNEAAAILWGRKPEIGKDLWCGSYRIFRPDGAPLALDQCPLAVTLREGRAVRGEEMIIERPDGTRRSVLPYPDPIRDAKGRIVGAVNMLLDITDSKRAEDASRRLAAIVESSQDAIISKDLNGIITSWNRGAERLFGYRADEVIGKPVTILMPAARYDEESHILGRIRRGEGIEQYETVRRRKGGSEFEISLTVSPIKDAGGKVIGASKIVRDITQQKEAERKLEQSHKDAVAASRAKDDFLAALSHELRTPLNPVLLLASEAAEDPHLSPEVRAQFDSIRRNVELEASLIDDLLDITRITHGKLSMDLGLVDIHATLAEALMTIRSDLDQKRITVAKELKADQFTVSGDAVRLQQVFWNVLKNAVKFTPEAGKITIATRLEGARELIVTVADTGIGMASGEVARIFEAFAQGDHGGDGGSHRFGGLGLGLAISRRLLELHSGSIRASSAGPDQGSTFTITLPLVTERTGVIPLPVDNPSPSPTPVNARAGTIHILLVEDHEPTRTALAHLLARRHYEVKTAASAAEARELSKQQVFQLLISDIGLPDGNGFELLMELRAGNTDLQGIALTGYGMEEDIACSRNAGFASHLIKPIRVQTLDAALATVAPR